MSRRPNRLWLALVAVAGFCALPIALLVPAIGGAEEPASEAAAESAIREKWQAVYREVAQSLEMRHGETKLALRESPLLFYTNPVRTTGQHGAIFLWTDEGRPAVFGSIWSAIDRKDPALRNVSHEWHSLLESPDVSAMQNDKQLWSSGEPGVEWQALVDSPVPAESRAGRLLQMRSLARRLTARIIAEEATDLRLMTQPLYRYPESKSGPLDGAVFVFVLATDPELIVSIEAQTSGRNSQYRIAFARFGNLAMEVKDGDSTLWTCDRGTPGRSEGKYYLHWRVEQRPAELTSATP